MLRENTIERTTRGLRFKTVMLSHFLISGRRSASALSVRNRRYGLPLSRSRGGGGVIKNIFVQRQFSALPASIEDTEGQEILFNVGKSTIGQPSDFQVTAKFAPTADQPVAIEQLMKQLTEGDRFSILQGITGTGKTLVMSHVIAGMGKPTLVLCHNKTLAAQLARELRSFLSHNAVELFVSYYNHYVPESFVEATGKYIAKKSSVNANIDTLRHRATRALLTRRDVVVVASVSCIYGLGLPKEYLDASMEVEVDQLVKWEDLHGGLINMLYSPSESDDDFDRGQYQVTNVSSGGRNYKIVTLWPPHDKFPMEMELEDTGSGSFRVRAIREGCQTGMRPMSYTRLFPAKHHVIPEDRLQDACLAIEDELGERVKELLGEGKRVEADRIQQRVVNDVMMLRETGFCSGGENYSRHFAGRAAGDPPETLMDYLSLHGDWLLMIDESHVTVPQLWAMYAGDQARKRRLVKHGYRLPSALDNRPLQGSEFWDRVEQTLFVSATPSPYELGLIERDPVEMIIRPTFVCDPVIEVRSKEGQLGDLLMEVQSRAQKDEKTLAITLTKRDAEDLSSFMVENGVNSTYLHSGLTTHERSDALKSLQNGEIDCLVGVNCLREGLDLPQVSLVAIFNTDSEGFLRSETALLQMVGRAARNVNGKALFYANRITPSMQKCIEATEVRRCKQLAYNAESGCEMKSTQSSSVKSIFDLLKDEIESEQPLEVVGKKETPSRSALPKVEIDIHSKDGIDRAIETGHIPSSPGVYFWKDTQGNTLYIGKAVKLRSRVKSYLSPKANHSARIQLMLKKATRVEFVLTPSDRDALVLESNLIKHYQPPFNVLLKDDEHYPYICASVGDKFPRFSIVPRRQESLASNRLYRYFGPYTSFKEINAVLEGIESKYDLRSKSFLARHGSLPEDEYSALFKEALDDVFRSASETEDESLVLMRTQYEQAGLLFDSKSNKCRDVVALHEVDGSDSEVIVHVVQLREGVVAGSFSYPLRVMCGFSSEGDRAEAVQMALETWHYPAGQEARDGRFSWFPDAILMPCSIANIKTLRAVINRARAEVEPGRKRTVSIKAAATTGQQANVDARALEFATQNAQQIAVERSFQNVDGSAASSLDGRASAELATLLALEQAPTRIECYDISHTQGEHSVASRVVFIDGKPAPHLYRKFNIQSVDGIDDYASLEEVLERRLRRIWTKGKVDRDGPWAMPDLILIDGGPGQLNAAIRGMSKAGVSPLGEEVQDSLAKVAVCALAKNEEQVFVSGRKGPVNKSPDSPGLLLLRALRDESHRFALNAHRQRRSISKSL